MSTAILLEVGATAGNPPPPVLEIVRADAKPQDPRAGDSVLVSVVVRNAGKSAAGNVAILLRAGGTALQTLPLTPLAPGAEQPHALKVQAPGKAGAWCFDVSLEPAKGPGAPFGKPRSVCLTVRAAKDAAGAKLQAPPGSTQQSGGEFAAAVVRIGQISSKAQFKALADDTLLEIDGRRIRKADAIAEFNRRMAAGPPVGATRPAGLAAIQARLAAEEEAAIAAYETEVRSGLAEIRTKGGDSR
ncbi:MAG: CARDB domain-containing protein [Candidatus Methylomirabilia bacterium]